MDDFTSLLNTITKILNFQCTNYKENYLKRRILSRMSALGISEYSDYNKFLLANAEEQERLKNALTINVTKFFRDPEVFSVIKSDLIPKILKNKQANHIRIWCAGCSSGEEPYSLAIILNELSHFNKDLDALIYATDIDKEMIKRAKLGIYDEKSLENLTKSQIRRDFILQDDGKYQVRPHLKEKIRFIHHDLMQDRQVARNLDIISCRNVTIYFNEEQKSDLTHYFHEGLVSEGFYIIGMSEFLGKSVQHLFKSYKPLQKVFTKNNQIP